MLRISCALALSVLASGCCCPFVPGGNSGTPPSAATSPAPVAAPVTTTAYDATFIAAHLARARAEAGCDATPTAQLGVFCPALVGWDQGAAAPLPGGSITLAGVTTWIPTLGSFAALDTAQRTFSMLALRADATGRHGRVVTARPESPAESLAAAKALTSVVERMRSNDAAPLPLDRGLVDFGGAQAARAEYPVASSGVGWQLVGGSFADIRRVGNRWVAIEVPRNAPAGLYFSVFWDSVLVAQ